jgi:hypothetical protein
LFLPAKSGEHSQQLRQTHDPRHPHCPVPDGGGLVAALRANDPDAFKCWLSGGVQDLGEPVVEEHLLDWIYSFLTVEEQDRLTG